MVAEIQKKIEDAFEVFDHDRGHTVDVRFLIFDSNFVYNIYNTFMLLLGCIAHKWPVITGQFHHCSVCLSVCALTVYDFKFWKNGCFDRDSFWGGGWGGPKENLLDWVQIHPWKQAIFGEREWGGLDGQHQDMDRTHHRRVSQDGRRQEING